MGCRRPTVISQFKKKISILNILEYKSIAFKYVQKLSEQNCPKYVL